MDEELAINPGELENNIEALKSVETEPGVAYSTLIAKMPAEGEGVSKGLSINTLYAVSNEDCMRLTSALTNLYSWTMQVMQDVYTGFVEADQGAADAFGNS